MTNNDNDTHADNALGLSFTDAHRAAIERSVERRAADVEVERQKKKVTTEITDTAWGAARLFEALTFAYTSVANNRLDDYKQALLAMNEIPKGDLIVGAVFVAHERICDDGTDGKPLIDPNYGGQVVNDVVDFGDGRLYIDRWGNQDESEQDLIDLLQYIGDFLPEIIEALKK